MHILFSAAEIFEIAIEVERNGAKFYRQASALIPDAATKRELLDLAIMEDNHEAAFLEMKSVLTGDGPVEWYDPTGEAALYMRTFAAGNVFDMTIDPMSFLTPETSAAEIIEYALDRERDSVVFFLGLKELVPEGLGADKIQSIIRQEMGHIVQLSRRLDELGRPG